MKWQIYKELELIPDSVPEPQANKLILALRLNQVWRSLSDTLTRKLSHEQQLEYLAKCLALDCSPGQGWRYLLNALTRDTDSQDWQGLVEARLVFSNLINGAELDTVNLRRQGTGSGDSF